MHLRWTFPVFREPIPPYLCSWSKTKIRTESRLLSIGDQNARKSPEHLMFAHFSSNSRDPQISLIKNHNGIQQTSKHYSEIQNCSWLKPKLSLSETRLYHSKRLSALLFQKKSLFSQHSGMIHVDPHRTTEGKQDKLEKFRYLWWRLCVGWK